MTDKRDKILGKAVESAIKEGLDSLAIDLINHYKLPINSHEITLGFYDICRENRIELARSLYALGAKFDYGQVTLALDEGHHEIIELIFAQQPDILNIVLNNGEHVSYFSRCVHRGFIKLAQLLEKCGADTKNTIAAHNLCLNNHSKAEVINDFILNHKDFELSSENKEDINWKHLAAKRNTKTAITLFKQGHITLFNNPEFLTQMIQEGNITLLEHLIANGIDIQELLPHVCDSVDLTGILSSEKLTEMLLSDQSFGALDEIRKFEFIYSISKIDSSVTTSQFIRLVPSFIKSLEKDTELNHYLVALMSTQTFPIILKALPKPYTLSIAFKEAVFTYISTSIRRSNELHAQNCTMALERVFEGENVTSEDFVLLAKDFAHKEHLLSATSISTIDILNYIKAELQQQDCYHVTPSAFDSTKRSVQYMRQGFKGGDVGRVHYLAPDIILSSELTIASLINHCTDKYALNDNVLHFILTLRGYSPNKALLLPTLDKHGKKALLSLMQ